MKGIIVEDSFVDMILGKSVKETKPAAEVSKVSESEDSETEGAEPEEHSCPLCESKLAEPISEAALAEHVDYILGIINENFSQDGESLDEDSSEDSEPVEEDGAE
jgi:hypothetical protein